MKVTVLTEETNGDKMHVLRNPIIPNNLPFNFKCLRFPLKVEFSVTINKSQGKTLKLAGMNLETTYFSHDIIYYI